MDITLLSTMLRTGDLEGLLNSIVGDDTVTDAVSCPCGKDNVLTVIRVGHTVLTWTNAPTNHGQSFSDMEVVAYASESDAIEHLVNVRAQLARVTSLAAMFSGATVSDFIA